MAFLLIYIACIIKICINICNVILEDAFMNKKYAILVVDMLNDFVTGALGCDRARAIVKPLQELLDNARKNNVPVIFCNDSHLKGIDKEFT